MLSWAFKITNEIFKVKIKKETSAVWGMSILEAALVHWWGQAFCLGHMELSFNIPVNSEQGYPLQGGSVRDQIVILRSLDGAQTTDNTVGMSANSPRKTSQSKESPSPWLLLVREAEHTALLKTQAPPQYVFFMLNYYLIAWANPNWKLIQSSIMIQRQPWGT